jgi:zinc D-Ala-D-Ala dipeptidase
MFGYLEEYRNKPIPNLDALREAKKGYRQWPIEVDPFRVGYADLRDLGIPGANFYHRPDNPPYYRSIPGSVAELYLRVGVIDRLLQVALQLRTAGLELFVHDAWRPQAVQTHFHDVWFPSRIRERYPDWDDERVIREVGNYWARGAASEADLDPFSPPPHSTGAATDLTIRTADGDHLWMGTIFDDVTERAWPDALERKDLGLSFSDGEAQKNRRLLYWVMAEAGFQVNPTEWWHFSYGDQMWAKLTSYAEGVHTSAFYSVLRP